MGRILTLAALGLALAVPSSAQQLLAWPLGSSGIWRGLLPGMPMPHPLPPAPRPMPLPRPMPAPRPAPALPPEAAAVTLSGYHVEGVVTDQVAELTYRITFHNPTGRRLEGVLLVPIPADTILSGFSMTVGDKMTKGELLDSAQAASIYESIVRRAQDPGLLELVGERMFRARVFPIEPRGDIVAVLKLTQTLPKSGGLVSLRVPMRSARFVAGESGKSSAKIEVRTTRPLRTVFSPSSEVRVTRSGDRAALVTYEEGAGGPQDLALMFSLQQDPLAAGVMTFREYGEDGTFLLTLSPKVEEAAAAAAPKDVVFVVDRSGSMQEGGKIDQAKKALQYCVSRLNPQDRFAVVAYDDHIDVVVESTPASREAKDGALRRIRDIDARGSTNLGGGWLKGSQPRTSRRA